MASRNLALLAVNTPRLLIRTVQSQTQMISKRSITTNESGALLERPAQVKLGLIKVAVTVTPFIYVGAIISREFAAWLEEHEFFVPDDDDDD